MKKDVSISGLLYERLRAECQRHQKAIAPVVDRIVNWALDNEPEPEVEPPPKPVLRAGTPASKVITSRGKGNVEMF